MGNGYTKRPISEPPSVPQMFRGNCSCGKWLMIGPNWTKESTYDCECGRQYFWQPMSTNLVAVMDFEQEGLMALLFNKEKPVDEARDTE